jgi:Sulfotransferase domain
MFDFYHLHSAISALHSKQIFFIGGVAKSGTTWLQILLNLHPNISCKGEGHFPNKFAPLLRRAIDLQNEYISSKNGSIFREIGGYPQYTEEHFLYLLTSAITLLLHEQTEHKSVQAIGEKTPDNICFFPLLDTIFPRAKFIQVVRDGRDSGVSGWFHNLRVSPEWTRQNFPSMDDYMKMYAEVWAIQVSEGSKFGAQQPTRYLAVRYEDLGLDPQGTIEKIFRFLGVESGQEIVEGCCVDGSFEKLSGGRSRGQENRDSFFRKGIAGDWRNYLSDEMNKMFQEKAGEWLARFGYI